MSHADELSDEQLNRIAEKINFLLDSSSNKEIKDAKYTEENLLTGETLNEAIRYEADIKEIDQKKEYIPSVKQIIQQQQTRSMIHALGLKSLAIIEENVKQLQSVIVTKNILVIRDGAFLLKVQSNFFTFEWISKLTTDMRAESNNSLVCNKLVVNEIYIQNYVIKISGKNLFIETFTNPPPKDSETFDYIFVKDEIIIPSQQNIIYSIYGI